MRKYERKYQIMVSKYEVPQPFSAAVTASGNGLSVEL